MKLHSVIAIAFTLVLVTACSSTGPSVSSDPATTCMQALSRWKAAASAKAMPEEVATCEQAARSGSVQIQLGLGYAYMKGVGVEKDEKRGVEWFTAAANAGSTDAQYNLGLAYAKGIGIKTDLKQAAQWFLGAAVQGDSGAQYALGVMFSLGQGVGADPVQAYAWFELAKEGGHPDAARTQAEVAKIMKADQLKRAQEHVTLFKQRIEQARASASSVGTQVSSEVPL